jgi:DNA-binding NtrC family response regulator
MENFQGDRKALAEQLGISERTLYRKLRNTEPTPD